MGPKRSFIAGLFLMETGILRHLAPCVNLTGLVSRLLRWRVYGLFSQRTGGRVVEGAKGVGLPNPSLKKDSVRCLLRPLYTGRGHKTGEDRWPSGRRRTLGKRVGVYASRGFESHSVRHFFVTLAGCFALTRCPASAANGRRAPSRPLVAKLNQFVCNLIMRSLRQVKRTHGFLWSNLCPQPLPQTFPMSGF